MGSFRNRRFNGIHNSWVLDNKDVVEIVRNVVSECREEDRTVYIILTDQKYNMSFVISTDI